MKNRIIKNIGIVCLCLGVGACTIPTSVQKTENSDTPEAFVNSQDTVNSAKVQWKDFFTDPYLVALIDTALNNNQELNIILREIQITQNEVRARKGEYLPFVDIGAGAGVEKVGRYTSQGANDANTEIKAGEEFPDPLPDFMLGAYASWEVDIWNKLHNAKKSAVFRYLSSIEGKNFMVTHLIAEIANSYFELMALDNQLEIVQQNLTIQTNALEIVKVEKASARVTELAVRRFQAEVLKNQSLQYEIRQKIVEMENRINFLIGRYPQPIQRNSSNFYNLVPSTVYSGIPSQLLTNRPDIRQAEFELAAAKLDINVARAEFYPSLEIKSGVGFRSFNLKYLVTPESMLYSLGGELLAPLVNRNAIRANFNTANAKQVQAVYEYEQRLLNAYIEVVNQMSMISNLEKSYDLKSKQVQALTESIDISTVLFRSARADYMEVLLTQRDALESRFELVETKKQQMNAMVNIYQALGGGWK
ncbi:MAG: efflux transporter outer membrane subunit [Cyclobacteriaceae bacterium]|nr:efflux transporter outer membrane subunit [Cyclobacteriaceae bacterium]